jgi:hypothetical protein
MYVYVAPPDRALTPFAGLLRPDSRLQLVGKIRQPDEIIRTQLKRHNGALACIVSTEDYYSELVAELISKLVT